MLLLKQNYLIFIFFNEEIHLIIGILTKSFAATDPASSTSRGHSHQVAPGVVIETFSVPVQGDGVPPEINRVSLYLSAVQFCLMI